MGTPVAGYATIITLIGDAQPARFGGMNAYVVIAPSHGDLESPISSALLDKPGSGRSG